MESTDSDFKGVLVPAHEFPVPSGGNHIQITEPARVWEAKTTTSVLT